MRLSTRGKGEHISLLVREDVVLPQGKVSIRVDIEE